MKQKEERACKMEKENEAERGLGPGRGSEIEFQTGK